MARDDFERRRLRGLYERSRRRGDRLADLRDRRRGNDDEERAPRHYVVSERRTRIEGFGRGGTQIRRVIRRVDVPRRRLRFSDRGVFRRGARDRFRRDDDFDREVRRERFLERRGGEGRRGREGRFVEERRGGEGRFVEERRGGGGGARFGLSRRRRLLRVREERQRGDGNGRRQRGPRGGEGEIGGGRRGEGRRAGGQRRRGGGERRGGDRQAGGRQTGGRQTGGRQTGDRRGARGGDRMPTRDQLDAQLDSYRRN